MKIRNNEKMNCRNLRIEEGRENGSKEGKGGKGGKEKGEDLVKGKGGRGMEGRVNGEVGRETRPL